MKKALVLLLAAALIAPVFAQGAQEAAKFPSRQITVLCQASAGGSSDLNCRTIAPGMESVLGVPVVVENKPGAGGGIALTYAANAPADGYLVAHLPLDIAQVKAAGNGDVTPADFRFLARVFYHPAAIVVKPDSPYQTIEEFVAAAKANPGKITVGNSGTGAVWHLGAVMFEKAAGVEFNHIPFEGASPSITAVMGGHVDAIVASAAEVASQVQSGDLKLLCVMADEPFGLFPEVPTAKSRGYEVSVPCWCAFGVAKDTPDDVFNTLLEALRSSFNTETYQNMLKTKGYQGAWLEGEAMDKFAMEEYELYSVLIPQVLGY